MSLLPRTTLHSDSEPYSSGFLKPDSVLIAKSVSRYIVLERLSVRSAQSVIVSIEGVQISIFEYLRTYEVKKMLKP
jgi:hypothetical protein